MNFNDLQRRREELRVLAEKRAGVVTTATKGLAKLPFKAVGGAGKAGLKSGHKALWNASKRTGGPLAPLMYGGALLGTGAAAGSAVSKARKYKRGFDPRIQQLRQRGYKL